jgi:phytanoyl-CoA hydroxylase
MLSPEPTASQTYMTVVGTFDGFRDMFAAGWAYFPNAPEVRPNIVLVVNGSIASTTKADVYRPDVAVAGYGDGRYGFSIPLPDRIMDGGVYEVDVRIENAANPISYTPRTFSAALYVPAEKFASMSPSIDAEDGDLLVDNLFAKKVIGRELAADLRKWRNDGYIIWRKAVAPAVVAKIGADLDAAIDQHRHVLYQHFSQVTSLRDVKRPIGWDDARVLEFHANSEAAQEALLGKRVVDFLRIVLEGDPVLMQSLLFVKGSRQRAHMDFPYVHTPKPGFLAASWVALEDVKEDAGPLFFFPGSHRLVAKYDFGAKNVMAFNDGAHIRHFEEYVDAEAKARGCPYELFMAEAGDVLIWHSALVHGGSPRTNPNATRRSLVGHYSPTHVYSRDRKHPESAPKVVRRNGGQFYDFQNDSDPKLEFKL